MMSEQGAGGLAPTYEMGGQSMAPQLYQGRAVLYNYNVYHIAQLAELLEAFPRKKTYLASGLFFELTLN